jgi:hypothetical protein
MPKASKGNTIRITEISKHYVSLFYWNTLRPALSLALEVPEEK